MLSFKNGKPIVQITGGRYHGKQLRIHDGTKVDDDYEYDMDKLRKFDVNQLSMINEAILKKNEKYLSGESKRVYHKIMNKGELGKDFNDQDCLCKIIPTNDPDQRDSIYITGPSGSGKSTFVSTFMTDYKTMHPKRPIFLFSAKTDDPALDKLHPLRIPLNQEMVADPVSLDELDRKSVV